MTYSDFMTTLEHVYGEYKSDIMKRITAQYISNNFSEDRLEFVMSKILLSVNPRFKTPPSPADFAEIFSIDPDAEGMRYWNELNKKINSWSDIIIDDIRAQKAVEAMGGWVAFCMRTARDENGCDIDHWNRKEFLKYFRLYTDNPPNEPIRRLRSKNGIDHEPILIGDRNKCIAVEDKSAEIMKQLNFVKGME